MLVEEMTADKGLADALAGAGIDLEAAVAGSGHDVMGLLGDLLSRAQRAGTIRADVSLADVKALMTGCLHDEHPLGGGLAAGITGDARRRRVEIVCSGLRSRRPLPGAAPARPAAR
jgi:hypothetical protein